MELLSTQLRSQFDSAVSACGRRGASELLAGPKISRVDPGFGPQRPLKGSPARLGRSRSRGFGRGAFRRTGAMFCSCLGLRRSRGLLLYHYEAARSLAHACMGAGKAWVVPFDGCDVACG